MTLRPSSLGATLTEKDPRFFSVKRGDRTRVLGPENYRLQRTTNSSGFSPISMTSRKGWRDSGRFSAALKEATPLVLSPSATSRLSAQGRRRASQAGDFRYHLCFGGMMVYIAFRFQWVYGAAAVWPSLKC